MLLSLARSREQGVLLRGRFRLGNFHRTPADIEGASGVAAHGSDFPAGKLYGVRLDDRRYVREPRLDDFLELGVGVPWKSDTCQPQPAANFVTQRSLREIHGISHSEHDQPAMS